MTARRDAPGPRDPAIPPAARTHVAATPRYARRMHLASTLRHLPAALLAATLTLACGPKNTGDDAGDSTGDTSSASSGGTTGAQQCTPGDIMMSDAGDCAFCVCSDAGTWECNRCDPTGGPLETTTGTTATTDATTTVATSTGPATTGETTTTTASTTSASSTAGETADTTTGGAGVLPTCMDLSPSDSFQISGAKIVGDELHVDVGYSGGCEDHDFTLCFDSIVLDTDLWNLAIDHDAHGDACEAFLMETRKFDLTPLQAGHESPFEFSLVGFEGDSLKYEF